MQVGILFQEHWTLRHVAQGCGGMDRVVTSLQRFLPAPPCGCHRVNRGDVFASSIEGVDGERITVDRFCRIAAGLQMDKHGIRVTTYAPLVQVQPYRNARLCCTESLGSGTSEWHYILPRSDLRWCVDANS